MYVMCIYNLFLGLIYINPRVPPRGFEDVHAPALLECLRACVRSNKFHSTSLATIGSRFGLQ